MRDNSSSAMVDYLAQRARSHVQSQIARVRVQTSLRGVVDLLGPQVPSHLRSLMRSNPVARELQLTCERAARRIVEGQMRKIRELPEALGAQMFNRLYTTEWQLLRGNFPKLFRDVERERLVRRTAEKPPRPA